MRCFIRRSKLRSIYFVSFLFNCGFISFLLAFKNWKAFLKGTYFSNFSCNSIFQVLSSPLFGRPSKILDKMLQSSSGLTDLAPKLSRNLCQRFIANEDAPPDIYEPGSERAGSGSLVLSFASGLWNILTFGYRYIHCTYLRLSKVAFFDNELIVQIYCQIDAFLMILCPFWFQMLALYHRLLNR